MMKYVRLDSARDIACLAFVFGLTQGAFIAWAIIELVSISR